MSWGFSLPVSDSGACRLGVGGVRYVEAWTSVCLTGPNTNGLLQDAVEG